MVMSIAAIVAFFMVWFSGGGDFRVSCNVIHKANLVSVYFDHKIQIKLCLREG